MRYAQGALIPLLLLALVGSVVAVPQLPAEFYGTVVIDGESAPAGTVIVALIGGQTCGSLETTASGTYGGSATFDERLLVGGDENDVGKTIAFLVAGVKANESVNYASGTVVCLNLTTKKGTPTPTPTPTTTPSPPGPSGGGGGGAPSGGGGGGGGASGAPSGPRFPLQPVIMEMKYTGSGLLNSDENGTVRYPTTIQTQNNDGRLYIDAGVRAKDMFGRALERVTFKSVSADDLPDIGEETVFGRALKGGPDGATFDPAVEIRFTLTPEEWEHVGAGEEFVVRWYDSKAERWEPLETVVYPSTRSVTAKVSHFTLFAVFAEAKPEVIPDSPLPQEQVSAEPTVTAEQAATPLPQDQNSSNLLWRFALAVLFVFLGSAYFFRSKGDK